MQWHFNAGSSECWHAGQQHIINSSSHGPGTSETHLESASGRKLLLSKETGQQTYKVVIHISGHRQRNWAPRSVFNLLKITQIENGRAGIWTHVFLNFKFALLSMTLILRWPRMDEGTLRTSEFGREHKLSLIVGSQTYMIRLTLDMGSLLKLLRRTKRQIHPSSEGLVL